MVILVSEEDPRAKSSQGARSKVREGSENRNCRDKGDGDCLGWEGKSNSGEADTSQLPAAAVEQLDTGRVPRE